MGDTTLKKEFTKRDVQRMRNLITGKTGDRTQVQAGWEKNSKNYKEGDVWEEDGKTWTIKRGIKQNITKLDSLKKLVMLPLLCPECNEPMKVNDLNKKAHSAYGVCLECAIKKETDMKIHGVYEDTMKKEGKAYVNAAVEDMERALDAWYNSNDSFLSEQGDVENWSGGNKDKLYEKAKEELKKLKHT
jgi:hypothetical protein